MQKALILAVFTAFVSSFSFASDNLTEYTNTPENRLSPAISSDGSEITEYLRKDTAHNYTSKHEAQDVVIIEEDVAYEKVNVSTESMIIKDSSSGKQLSTNTPENRLSPAISSDGSEITEYIRK